MRALPPLKAPGSDEGPPMFPFPGRLVDYDDDDDALPIGGGWMGGWMCQG